MSRSCSCCRFWERVHAESDVGQCRRYPPQASDIETTEDSPAGLAILHDWPLTLANNWCGEFISRVLPFVHPSQPAAN
jgi:hypothetical protein